MSSQPAATWPPAGEAPPSRRGPRALGAGLAVALVGVALVGLELGSASAVDRAIGDGRELRDRHAYREAEAQFRATAARSGPAYLLARARLAEAAREASTTDLDWAGYAASTGQPDLALAVLDRVTSPVQAAQARRQAGEVALAAASAAAARGAFDAGLHRLDQVAAVRAPADLVAAAQAARPAMQLGRARAALAGGRAVEAVADLDALTAAATTPADVLAPARALLPSALLDAGRQLDAAGDGPGAVPYLDRLVSTAGSSHEAGLARGLLATPQPVTGTLVRRDGNPAAHVAVRLGSDFRFEGTGFVTDPPYYASSTDANGVFVIDRVPVGVPLVLEFNDGGWTVRTSRGSNGREAATDNVLVTPLAGTDLGFVREP